jgi:hypothetical protein
MVFGQEGAFYSSRGLGGIRAPSSLLKRFLVVPGHPGRRLLCQLGRMFLQFGEVVEGIDAVQFAGMDQTHEQIPHLGAVRGLIEQTVLPATERFP